MAESTVVETYLTVGLIVGAWAWFGSVALAADVAEKKGFNAFAWIVIGLLFGVLALVAAAGLPDKRARASERPSA